MALKILKNTRDRVFILGPAHHVDLRRCALPSCTEYDTPLGILSLDIEGETIYDYIQKKPAVLFRQLNNTVITSLEATGAFARMDLQTDEDEHSIEQQLPFIRHQLAEYEH